MLKKKTKSYVVCVVFLSYFEICVSPEIRCLLGYKKRIILSIDNEWCHKVNCDPSSGYFIIVNSGVGWGGVCVRGGVGCLGGWGWRSPLVVMGGWKGVENTQKSQNHMKYKGERIDKNLSERGVGGWMGVIHRIKESRSPSVEITSQGPWPLGKSLIGLPGL